MSAPPIQYTGPAISPEVPWDTRVHLQALYQKLANHTQAFSLLSQKPSGSTTTNTTVLESIVTGGGPSPTPVANQGVTVNNQSGVTSYGTQSTDDNSMIVFSDASPVAVSLTTQAPPWSCFVSNQGAGTVTLTPAVGTISYAGNPSAATMPVAQGLWALIAFDGENWWAAIDAVGGSSGVTQLIAGAGIALSPAGGTGAVTVTVIGATGSYTSGNNSYGYWQKDPDGLIRQWGKVSAGVTGTVVPFPTAFSNAASIEVNTTSLWPGYGSIAFVSVEGASINTAQFQVAMGVTSTQDFNWFAIGY